MIHNVEPLETRIQRYIRNVVKSIHMNLSKYFVIKRVYNIYQQELCIILISPSYCWKEYQLKKKSSIKSGLLAHVFNNYLSSPHQ